MRNVFVFLAAAVVFEGGCGAPVGELDTPMQSAQPLLGGGGVTIMMYRVPCPAGVSLSSGQTCRSFLGASVWKVPASAMPQEGREIRLGGVAYLGRRPGGALIANAVTRFDGSWATYPSVDATSGCRDVMWLYPPWHAYPWRLNAVGGEIMLFDGVGEGARQIVSANPDDFYLSTVERVVSGAGVFAFLRCSLHYGSLARLRQGDYPGDYTVGFWKRIIESYSSVQYIP